MLLERVLRPLTKNVLIYQLVGHDDYGQPQFAPMLNAPRRGLIRRSTRIEQRGEKAISVNSVELILSGVEAASYNLLGAKVAIDGESKEYVVRAVRREGDPFVPILICELEAIQ